MWEEWKRRLAEPDARRVYAGRMRELNERLNCCTEIFAEEGEGASAGNGIAGAAPLAAGGDETAGDVLRGAPFAIKDNIALAGRRLSCASDMLKEFVAPYSATVAQRLLDRGAVAVAKTNLDEFGMGSSTENSCFGATRNPWDRERSAGGSSGGAAAAVAAGMVPFAIGSDTGGSVRQPAAFCGVYGLKPTYGALSRFGLVAYASSLETVGIIGESAEGVRAVFEACRGGDGRDQTAGDGQETAGDGQETDGAAASSVAASSAAASSATPSAEAPPVIGYISQFARVDGVIEERYREMVATLGQMGYRCREVTLPYPELIAPAYYTIASAEASANLARYDGVKYGARHGFHQSADDMTRATRSANFGREVKLRILLGSYVLRSGFQKQYYLKAQQIRQRLTARMRRIFTEIDLLALPAFPTPPFRLGGEFSPFRQKQADTFTCIANLTAQPALSLPVAMHGALPVGMQFIARHHEEEALFDVASRYRQNFQIGRPPHYLS